MMCRLLCTSGLLLSLVLSQAQCLDSLGLDNATSLNRCEQEVLVELGGSWPHSGQAAPVVSFRYGNSAHAISRSDFFKREILPWLQRGERPSVQWYVLSAQEREDTGVDALAVAWSKIELTERAKRRAIHQLIRANAWCGGAG